MAIHPMEAAKALEKTYRSYLNTTFAFKDAELNRQLEKVLQNPGAVVKGPYLEATPPFAQGRSLKKLCSTGLLDQGLLRIDPKKWPLDRKLWHHQEESILKLTAGSNMVVATGTASGKTECFLIPILNHLLCEHRAGTLDAGVRALLIYPMNALVNDQLGKLRKYLATIPEITFGRFTGDTERSPRKARDEFRKEHSETPILPNERLSREEMIASPPHILITNFAMLEFMLLRPSESPFFDPPYNSGWKFIVLDEAHTYGGAKGAEIAMLIRRLKQRVVGGRKGALQCIATSATLGRGIEDAWDVARFAADLFGEEFKWDPSAKQQDVVFAKYLTPTGYSGVWTKSSLPYYQNLAGWLKADTQNPPEFLKKAGVPESLYAQFYNDMIEASSEVAAAINESTNESKAPDDPIPGILFNLLRYDPKIMELRNILAEKPQEPRQAAAALWPDLALEEALEELVHLVDLAVQAKGGKDDTRLLSARYHFFARALEGAFISFAPTPLLTLNRETRREGTVFEVAICNDCGQVYLAGTINADNILEQPRAVGAQCEYYLLAENLLDPDHDDEDERILADLPAKSAEKMFLCPWCGRVHQEEADYCCEQNKAAKLMPTWHIRRTRGGFSRCGSCGTRTRDPIRRVVVGRDAPVAVLASGLYEQIKPGPKKKTAYETKAASSFIGIRKQPAQALEARKLLVFSDSRQEAAYFSWFFGQTHRDILWRRAILKAVTEAEQQWGDVMVDDIIQPLVRLGEEAGLLIDQGTPTEREQEVWRYLMREFRAGPRLAGLESVGGLAFTPYWNGVLDFENSPLRD
ncbi:MAG: DEAD/DEAH box helicase, partial [Firmicutes bacterium]|nr:DEAD/DEAH box helicase [Bacillota bacterium]